MHLSRYSSPSSLTRFCPLPSAEPWVSARFLIIPFYNNYGALSGLVNVPEQKLKGTRSIRNVFKNCIKCKRYNGREQLAEPGPLPADCVRDAKVFEVVGLKTVILVRPKHFENKLLMLFEPSRITKKQDAVGPQRLALLDTSKVL
ncbi:hypothetical protein CEXT_8881 [Caerostris extrusa]|uniref:Uncharacterized protein n=1 Tax=Caerostris extrusa TaxID=172846 RepID=A0AAV4QPW8_CAEEX|nr:hypothetical protein CEXT_8881 [Caerostris extrusa]